MKIILTLLIMLGVIFGFLLYFIIFSLFLSDDHKYLTVPYGSMFFLLIVVFYEFFILIYNSL